MESIKKNTIEILTNIREGIKVTIEKIDSGMSLKGRLAELGIYPGECIKVLRNSKRGPVLVNVKDSTFMLGRGMAEKIFVS